MKQTAGSTLLRETLAPAAAAMAAMVAAGLLLAVGRTLQQAPVAPDPVGLMGILLALLPSVLGLALPVAAFFGLLAAARSWREGGDWLALATAGFGARAVVPSVLLAGALLGLGQGLLTHWLEPLGRARVRRALVMAAGDLRLQPDRPALLGSTLVHARSVEGPELGEVFLAVGPTVIAARTGRLDPGGTLLLRDGQALPPGAPAPDAWTLSFAEAELRLDLAPPRVELVERSHAELRQVIARIEAAGKDTTAASLVLARRSALPFCLPLLGLLALPLGARGAQPGLSATVTVIAWWVVLRLSDLAAPAVGPLLAAWLPVLSLALAAGVAWGSWRER